MHIQHPRVVITGFCWALRGTHPICHDAAYGTAALAFNAGDAVDVTHADIFNFEYASYDDARVFEAHRIHYARVRADVASALWSVEGVRFPSCVLAASVVRCCGDACCEECICGRLWWPCVVRVPSAERPWLASRVNDRFGGTIFTPSHLRWPRSSQRRMQQVLRTRRHRIHCHVGRCQASESS